MARVLLAVALLALATPVAEAAKPPALTLAATGEIGKLGLGRISIGRASCTIPARLLAKAARFVIGDWVKRTCLGGKLTSLKYTPELATAQTSRPSGSAAPYTK